MLAVQKKEKSVQDRKGFQMPFPVPSTLRALDRNQYIQKTFQFCLGNLNTVRRGHENV